MMSSENGVPRLVGGGHYRTLLLLIGDGYDADI